MAAGAFTELTPDRILDAVEAATGRRLTAFTHPLNSYINRVYELQAANGERLIAKFYRPGRWQLAALEDEHRFVQECAEAEIPVVQPCSLSNGKTIGVDGDIYFAVFPKRRGREFEVTDDDGWLRLGRLLGRLHAVGRRRPAPARLTLHPEISTVADIAKLVSRGCISRRHQPAFKEIAERIVATAAPLFRGVRLQRIHGDCHRQNILERPEEGLMVIDFDDMATAPPVQDLWMLLPDRADRCGREIALILEGYGDFLDFDHATLRLIEPLRAMRMLYYLAWCSTQLDDPLFARRFPDWGTENFWAAEINELRRQLEIMRGGDR